MKNKILFVSLFLAFNFNLSAQIFTKQSIHKFNKQYSVKTTSWIESKYDLPSSPYQLTIKTLGEKSNKRFSAGINLNTIYSRGISSSLSLNMRFGKERFFDFGKNAKWRFFYGLDYLVNASASVNSNWGVGNIGAGIAPFAGLQYRINERLVVYTETNYELSVSGFASNKRNFQARLNSRLVPLGSIWLGFELFKPQKS